MLAAHWQDLAGARKTPAVPSAATIHARPSARRPHSRQPPGSVRYSPAAGSLRASKRSPHRHDLADFDGAEFSVRALGRDRNRRLDAWRLNEEVPGDHFLGLRERSVQHSLLALPCSHLLSLDDRVQRRAALQRAISQQVHRVLADALHGVLTLLVSRHHFRVFVKHQHEVHVPPRLLSAIGFTRYDTTAGLRSTCVGSRKSPTAAFRRRPSARTPLSWLPARRHRKASSHPEAWTVSRRRGREHPRRTTDRTRSSSTAGRAHEIAV